MFHQLRMPDWMHKLFALPELLPDQLRALDLDPCGPSVPCLATLPMGFEDSVFLAQVIIEHLLEPLIPRARFLHHRPDISVGPVVSLYIDDIIPLALVQHRDTLILAPRCSHALRRPLRTPASRATSQSASYRRSTPLRPWAVLFVTAPKAHSSHHP
jgi:hypothetical protein